MRFQSLKFDDRKGPSSFGQTRDKLWEENGQRIPKSDKLIVGDLNDFHNAAFDFTFEDVMMYDLQNIHDDLQIQNRPLIHQNFENMR